VIGSKPKKNGSNLEVEVVSIRNRFYFTSEELLCGLSDFLHSPRWVPCPTILVSPLSRVHGNPKEHQTSSISTLTGDEEAEKVVEGVPA
jgi:hypothetical protein